MSRLRVLSEICTSEVFELSEVFDSDGGDGRACCAVQVALPPELQYHDPFAVALAAHVRGRDGRALVQQAIRAAGWATGRRGGGGGGGGSGTAQGLTESLAALDAPVVRVRHTTAYELDA